MSYVKGIEEAQINALMSLIGPLLFPSAARAGRLSSRTLRRNGSIAWLLGLLDTSTSFSPPSIVHMFGYTYQS